MTDVPSAWYNVLGELAFQLPPDLPSPRSRADGLAPRVPPTLLRQELRSLSPLRRMTRGLREPQWDDPLGSSERERQR